MAITKKGEREMSKPETMMIDDVKYVREDSIKATPPLNADNYVIIRTKDAGVHAGYLISRDGNEAVLEQSRRIWYWKGAASLSELAMKGSAIPSQCKVPCAVAKIILIGVIEVIPCSQVAREQIEGMAKWTMH
jgi:hypothetical protein